MTRIVISGGGTGGHLYPALAVVEALKGDPEIDDILYIGNRTRKEAELVPKYGISFKGLSFSGMPRRVSPRLLLWTFDLIKAFFIARSYLKQFVPDAVFTTGGYVTAPVLLAALSLRIPYVIHEPDAYPGLVNRIMSRWARAVTSAFPAAKKRLKTANLHVTGNPLRSKIGMISKDEALATLNLPLTLENPILLVTGGSQGARRINQAVIEALPRLINQLELQIIHQTGDKLFDEVSASCPSKYLNKNGYYPVPFIENMAATLALADIAVCRSGSMSLSEMYRAHIPTILVPYPYAAADHQKQNAIASEEANASIMIEDSQFTGEKLFETLLQLLSEKSLFDAMRKSAELLSAPNATTDVIGIIKSVIALNLS